MNSVDASSSASLVDVLEQIRLIAECGIDFIEISGGSYEDPSFMTLASPAPVITKKSTLQREAFFLEFAQAVRKEFPKLVLMVTGGFRTRTGMEAALVSGACDLVGIGRPAAVKPRLPKEIILNTTDVTVEKAHVILRPVKVPFFIKHFPLKVVGAGANTRFYTKQIQRMGSGLEPLDGLIA